MSVFEQYLIRCPHCNHEELRTVATSINGGRSPLYRQSIMNDEFQRFLCCHCEGEFIVDGPFIYLDFDRFQWFGVYPAVWERHWSQLEVEVAESFERSVAKHAPPCVRGLASSFSVRAVFGLVALREKLLCSEAAVDDRLLEVLKLDLMRSTPGFGLISAARPRLLRVEADQLSFQSALPATSTSMGALVDVSRSALDEMNDRKNDWETPIAELSAGPYVDVGRLLSIYPA